MSDKTQWQPIKGYESIYEVSRSGEVRKASGAHVGQWRNDQGYMIVRLSNPRKQIRVHRIVAQAFCCRANESLDTVNHIDCNRANNSAENLEWCTQKQNLTHADKLGRMQKTYWVGKRSPSAILSDETAGRIRREYLGGCVSWSALGEKYGICKRSVGRIVKGESYVA